MVWGLSGRGGRDSVGRMGSALNVGRSLCGVGKGASNTFLAHKTNPKSFRQKKRSGGESARFARVQRHVR